MRCDRRCFLRASKGFPHFSESYGESGLVFLPDVSKRACSPYCSWWPSGVRNVGWSWHWMAEWRNGKKLRARLYYWAPESTSLKTIYFNTFSYANYKCPSYLNRLEQGVQLSASSLDCVDVTSPIHLETSGGGHVLLPCPLFSGFHVFGLFNSSSHRRVRSISVFCRLSCDCIHIVLSNFLTPEYSFCSTSRHLVKPVGKRAPTVSSATLPPDIGQGIHMLLVVARGFSFLSSA